MKGLRHNVIEINDTENDDIERILVFLKPQAESVAINTTRAQASQLLKELDVKKVRRVNRRKAVIAAAVTVLVAVVCVIVAVV